MELYFLSSLEGCAWNLGREDNVTLRAMSSIIIRFDFPLHHLLISDASTFNNRVAPTRVLVIVGWQSRFIPPIFHDLEPSVLINFVVVLLLSNLVMYSIVQ